MSKIKGGSEKEVTMLRLILGLNIMAIAAIAGNVNIEKFGWPTFDHDTGNCILSVCANGNIGFWDSNQSQGSGFWYPKWVNPTIFFGSNACGNSTHYVVDGYFGRDWIDDRDWKPIGDSIYYHIPPEFGLQEVDCSYNDSGYTNPTPLGLECYQYSVAGPDSAYDDFVIIEYIYKNVGPNPINGLYSAVFSDFDIPDHMHNYGKTDSQLRTVYMMKSLSNDNPTVGIVYLGCEPQAMLPLANLAPTPHYDYVQTGFLDSFKYFWMNGTYQKAESDSEGDWSVMISAGPFNLGTGAEQHVAYALVGGTSESEYLQHCQRAIEFYEANWPEVAEGNNLSQDLRLRSNIVRDNLTLDYDLKSREEVRILLFDVVGRMVGDIYQGGIRGSGKINYRVEDLAAGVYFLNIERKQGSILHKILVVR